MASLLFTRPTKKQSFKSSFLYQKLIAKQNSEACLRYISRKVLKPMVFKSNQSMLCQTRSLAAEFLILFEVLIKKKADLDEISSVAAGSCGAEIINWNKEYSDST